MVEILGNILNRSLKLNKEMVNNWNMSNYRNLYRAFSSGKRIAHKYKFQKFGIIQLFTICLLNFKYLFNIYLCKHSYRNYRINKTLSRYRGSICLNTINRIVLHNNTGFLQISRSEKVWFNMTLYDLLRWKCMTFINYKINLIEAKTHIKNINNDLHHPHSHSDRTP